MKKYIKTILILLIGIGLGVLISSNRKLEVKEIKDKTIILSNDNYITLNDSDAFTLNGEVYSFNSSKDKVKVKNIITESNQDFYLDPGDIITEYSDGSYTIENTVNNTYIFQAACLGDWEYICSSKEELNKIVNTYLSIKNNGYY